MQKSTSLIALMLFVVMANCQVATQDAPDFILTVLNERSEPAEAATVELLKDNKLVKAGITDAKGMARFEKMAAGDYIFSVTIKGYQPKTTGIYHFPSTVNSGIITLQSAKTTLQEVSVTGRKPFVQHKQGKVILNVEAAVTNVGTTVLEVLEKSPGVTVDRNGGIALQGKTGVLVLIDDKPTYLSGADLNNLLSSMSSSQVELIELMANPPAKYDASGNAGIINIKTKKNKVKGFNGSFTVSASQGIYPKNNNSLLLNYRRGKFNTFLTYSMNLSKYLTDIYALRKYFDNNGALTAILDQPTYFSGTVFNNTLKAGVDYYAGSKTTIGLVLGGTTVHRKGASDAGATWLDPTGNIDSTIYTTSSSNNKFKTGSVNLNLRHTISSQQDLAVNIDWLSYDISSKQHFDNQFLATDGYKESSTGNIPTAIQIVSGKLDHTLRFGKNNSLRSGWKSSHIDTDNTASYQNFDGITWQEDYGKSNHFLYKENIHALYSSLETKYRRFSMQGGLRYEYTGYNAHQLGNVQQKDSAFSRNYSGLFPSGYISYEADSSNNFTLTAGRRIDRPAFQKLNPFTFIINKYTYQTGNPFFLPQYSWNFQLGHQYKNILTTSVSYSIIKNYFSQLFLTDTAQDILFYSEGNVGKARNFGLSSTLMVSPFKWWSLTAQANFNHKELKGFNGNENFRSDINQLNININNQFTIRKKYTAEISGFYTSRARNDLQEVLYPTGQLSLGVSRPVLKKKGTLKFSARDIFYTNAMEGLTRFENATEYFILRRDSRVISLSFSYRFGKAYKTTKRTAGSAGDEIERVGNG
ncbi:MAG TPA: outer membrane beta-barrel family protein [Ferruginibacter sp.]|nr:outer membrane beta-barrel family protein [Ferruginibacter sp.]